ncbi:hypothetical protein PsorP6_018544 [Peronosclerospora sorghi]|nr:hypothetical protein PsorP6_018544 [Peronosclerospora sorghi]
MDLRLYGIPIIQRDIPAPAQRSIEVIAMMLSMPNGLLYPEESVFKGVTNTELASPHRPAKVSRTVQKRAAQNDRSTPVGEGNITEYRDVLNDFLVIQNARK